MPEKRFRVLATDGEHIWGIIFITQNSKGDFYAGPISPTVEFKASRHQSGIWRLEGESLGTPKDPEERKRRAQRIKQLRDQSGRKEDARQKLTDFQGREEFFNLTVPRSGFSRQAIGSPYDLGRYDGTVFIDMRKYDSAGIQVHLLEPLRMDLLSPLSRFIPDSQITIFTQTRPWLVVLVYNVPGHDSLAAK